MNPTKALINLENLRFNLVNIKEQVGNRKILMAVKANAYGHGAERISQFVEKENLVDYLGIAVVNEGIAIRKSGVSLPILKFSECFEDEFKDLLKYNIEIAAYSEDFLLKINDFFKKHDKIVNIHIKVDTGMGRVGIPYKNIDKYFPLLKSLKNIKIKGIMTHFPVSDSKDKTFTLKQINIFKNAVNKFKENNIIPEIVHSSNSGAVIDHEESYFDMVRPGIMTYGYYPSNETSESIKIKPVMTLMSKISYIKKVPENTPISYGLTYRTETESYIATIPVGYGDGYNRNLSNKANVSIKGHEFKISGRICMDQFMIDLKDNKLNIQKEDDVVLFGKYDRDHISLYTLSDMLNTITYELLCNVGGRVPRIYI